MLRSPTRNVCDPAVVRSSDEECLYQKWQCSEEMRKEAEQTAAQLQNQVKELLSRITHLEKQTQMLLLSRVNKEEKHVEYCTDEEELNRETEWLVQRNRAAKKRKASSPPNTSPQQPTQPIKEKKLITSNSTGAPRSEKPRNMKPPPVIVEKQADYQNLYNLIKESEVKINFKTTLLGSGDIKVNVEDSEMYRQLTTLLKKKNINWYSFENKQTRPIKVMVRKLHPSCPPEKVVEYVRQQQLKILSAVNILKRADKTPLPLFMLSFDNSEDVKRVYEIKEILGMQVSIEPVRASKFVPQCKNCQVYGHTHKYCRKDPRSVRCAGKHLTMECTKSKQSPPKCANCGENHPANYRGCLVAKEIQKMRKPVKKAEARTLKTEGEKNKVIIPVAGTIASTSGVKSYAQVVKKSNNLKSTEQEDKPVESLLIQLFNKISELEAKQDKFNNSLSERLAKLEKINKKAGNRKNGSKRS